MNPGPIGPGFTDSSTESVDLGASDFSRLEARGADLYLFGRATDLDSDALDVGVPAPLGAPVRVGDAVPETRALAAEVTVRSHDCSKNVGRTSGSERAEKLFRPVTVSEVRIRAKPKVGTVGQLGAILAYGSVSVDPRWTDVP